jgi:hypothetical protein
MKITKGGRELTEDQQVRFLMKELGWSESRARQRVQIGSGNISGDIVWPEGMEPPPLDMSIFHRPVKAGDSSDDAS